MGIVENKSCSEENTGFQPIFRSGSCAEKGPKQYMEDEHICVDNLIKHLGSASDIPSPGAFYGVSIALFFLDIYGHLLLMSLMLKLTSFSIDCLAPKGTSGFNLGFVCTLHCQK